MKYVCFLGWCIGLALIGLSSTGSLLRPLGALLFFGFSLALTFLYIRFAIRSLKSGRRSVGLTMVGGLALLVCLFVFVRLNLPGDKAEITRTIEAVATSTDPTYCSTRVTSRYLEQTTGAKPPFADEICKSEADTTRVDSVDTSDVTVTRDQATAVAEYTGGSFDGSRLVVQLVKDGGDWKLDRIVAFRRFDRNKFNRAYRRSFLEFGSPASSANCALAKALRFSNAEIEQAALRNISRVFVPIFVACDRDGAERNLVKSIADSKFDLPTASIQCVAIKVKTLSDTALARLQLDPLAYGELLYRCGRDAFIGYFRRELKTGEDLNSEATECVLADLRSQGAPAAIRLVYNQTRFQAVIDGCRQQFPD